MKVLVAFEFSGVVRSHFTVQGHEAWSCDLLPSEIPGRHFQCDIRQIDFKYFDLMIAHPPCTYLSAAGLHYCKNNPERERARDEAVRFVRWLSEVPTKRKAIENPIGYLSTAWRKPDQIVYMNDFGHVEARKPTCLWLTDLPKLTPTKPVNYIKGRDRESLWYSKTKNQKDRSRTFRGFAQAIVEQWGTLANP